MHKTISASMLGHLRLQYGVFPSPVPINDRRRDVLAVGCSASSSSSSSLRSSLTSNGVSSVVLLEAFERFDRVDGPDLWEPGRELGVRVEAHGPSSGVSIAARRLWGREKGQRVG